MIRKYETDDLPAVMKIWLESNIYAHHFIEEQYWRENYKVVKETLPHAKLLVYEDEEQVKGFIGLNDFIIKGVFVETGEQSRGIGRTLLDYVKEDKFSLSLGVYKKNERAVSFYQREDFVIKCQKLDELTNEVEFTMNWQAKY